MAADPDRLLPVILAGGSGTRLWPLSRQRHPKQFLELVGGATLLQQTLARLNGLPHEPPVIVCHEEHRFIVAEQCRGGDFDVGAIMLEPASRNTAPAAALAAFMARRGGADPLLLVLPADHLVADDEAFREAVSRGARCAGPGALVLFGIPPTGAETGYGYIKADPLGRHGRDVVAFAEKPAREVAEQFINEGGWYWNSGMFLFRASAYLDELRTHRPDIHDASAAAVAGERAEAGFHRPAAAFRDCPSESIDRAVMEQTDRALMVEADMGWSDVGNWDALASALPCDDAGNTKRGDVVDVDSRDCQLWSNGRLIATLGVKGLIVAETTDAVLVADRSRAQDVPRVVERLAAAARPEHRVHSTDHRPWGRADTLEAGDGFVVQRLTVAPGKATPRMRDHRARHWVVVRGEAEIARGEERFTLREGESTFVPAGVRHGLANAGGARVVVIEVRTGSRRSDSW